VIFSFDHDTATRFKLRLIRPGAQIRLPQSLRDLINTAWIESESTLDLSRAVDNEEGLWHLLTEVASMVWEHAEFSHLQHGIEDALKHRSIVDRIGWLDENHHHPVREIKSSDPRRPRGRIKKEGK
jgi:hypothetical protein